jgi:hypothetical protein
MHISFRSLVTSFFGVAAMGLVSTASQAGQFKTLNTENLAAGTSLRVSSSLLNNGPAAEMEVYEFRSAATGGFYQCNIVQNGTGKSMNLIMLGVNATVIGSCTALPGGGSCSTPTRGLVGNLKFMCVAATGNGSPVTAGTRYIFSVSREESAPESSLQALTTGNLRAAGVK